MDIQVSAAKLTTEKGKDVSREEVIDYARQQVADAVEMFDIDPISVHVTLYTEGSDHDPVHKIDIKVVARNKVINQSAHSRSAIKAIDRAVPDLRRQLKKLKGKKIDRGRDRARGHKRDREEQARETAAEDM